MAMNKIGLHDLEAGLAEFLAQLIESGGGGGKFSYHEETQTATVDGQTEFDIPLDTFDVNKDAIWVYEGMLTLHRDEDYTIADGKIILNEGVPVDTTITTFILKQVTQMEADEYISGLLIEPGTLPLDRLAESVGGSIATIKEHYVATEGQTVFPIACETFDNTKDDLTVVSGVITLTEDYDYTVEGRNIVFVSPVTAGRTVHIKILKNVKTDKVEETFSGVYVEPHTLPVDRLVENVVTCDIPMHMRYDENGGLVITVTYDDGTEVTE